MNVNKTGNTAESITARAARLSGLIDYQEGSIVSKEIIKSEKGTVTLFAF